MEFPSRELKKFFKMGDHVKVIAGGYEGDTGLIVCIENNIAIIFSDLTLHEVCGCVHVYVYNVCTCIIELIYVWCLYYVYCMCVYCVLVGGTSMQCVK